MDFAISKVQGSLPWYMKTPFGDFQRFLLFQA
jgi:hypothetical protein